MLRENDKDGPPRDRGTSSLQSYPLRSDSWKSAYSRRGSRAVLLSELRLQGGIACVLQLAANVALTGVAYAQVYSLDSRLIHIPIATWVIVAVISALGLSGLVLLRSLLLGLHVALSVTLGAGLGAYHAGVYLLLEDRCARTQSSFLGCSAAACTCAAASSCSRAELRSAACAGCRAWSTDVCAKLNKRVLPYMGLALLLCLVIPAVFSLLVAMRLEKSHSDLASRVMYARALVLRELERLQSGGGLGLEPRVLTQLMATLQRHGGRADRGPVRTLCELLQLEPGALEVEWRDVADGRGAAGGGRFGSSMAGPSFAGSPFSYFADRGRGPPSTQQAPGAAGSAVPPGSMYPNPVAPPLAPAPTTATAAEAAAGGAARPVPAPLSAWASQPTPPPVATRSATASGTAAAQPGGPPPAVQPGSAPAAAAAATPPPPSSVGLPWPPLAPVGDSSARQRSFLWHKLEVGTDPGPPPLPRNGSGLGGGARAGAAAAGAGAPRGAPAPGGSDAHDTSARRGSGGATASTAPIPTVATTTALGSEAQPTRSRAGDLTVAAVEGLTRDDSGARVGQARAGARLARGGWDPDAGGAASPRDSAIAAVAAASRKNPVSPGGDVGSGRGSGSTWKQLEGLGAEARGGGGRGGGGGGGGGSDDPTGYEIGYGTGAATPVVALPAAQALDEQDLDEQLETGLVRTFKSPKSLTWGRSKKQLV